jgi:hypothetical protein
MAHRTTKIDHARAASDGAAATVARAPGVAGRRLTITTRAPSRRSPDCILQYQQDTPTPHV